MIDIPLSQKVIFLEAMMRLIDDNLIQDELPFQMLADHYPSLLERWYPGYPVEPRMMTPEDPIRCDRLY